MPLSREQILAISDLQIEEISVPEWGDSVFVRGLTGAERDDFEASTIRMKKKGDFDLILRNARARLVSMTAVDKDGNRLFTEQDIDALGKKNARAIARLYDAAQRLSGLTAEDMEELTKN